MAPQTQTDPRTSNKQPPFPPQEQGVPAHESKLDPKPVKGLGRGWRRS